MDYKKYIKNRCLILPNGFNSPLDCSGNNLTSLILPEKFNSVLYCSSNNLTSLILPEGFNSYLNAGNAIVYTHKQWKALERNRKIEELLID